MKLKGNGYCKSGYYAGWDNKGTANQDACDLLCLSEEQCTFAAYFKDQTCNRYKDKSCILDTSNNFERAYTTYYKDFGAQGIFYYFFMIMHIDYHKFRIAKLRTLNFAKKTVFWKTSQKFSISDDFENKFRKFILEEKFSILDDFEHKCWTLISLIDAI